MIARDCPLAPPTLRPPRPPVSGAAAGGGMPLTAEPNPATGEPGQKLGRKTFIVTSYLCTYSSK